MNIFLTVLMFMFSSFCFAQGLSPQYHKLQTILGTVEVVRLPLEGGSEDDLGLPDTIQVDGENVYRSPFLYIGLYKSFKVDQGVAVLFGVNEGGSATPVDELNFLILMPNKKPVVISDKDFYSADSNINTKQKHVEVIVDLGFEGKQKKVAILRGDKLIVKRSSVQPFPLKDKECKWLYEYSMQECAEASKLGDSCENYGRHYSGGSNVAMIGITSLSNEPGFDSTALGTLCVAECKLNKSVTYKQFKKPVCSIQ